MTQQLMSSRLKKISEHLSTRRPWLGWQARYVARSLNVDARRGDPDRARANQEFSYPSGGYTPPPGLWQTPPAIIHVSLGPTSLVETLDIN
jgi:hypothetical protein